MWGLTEVATEMDVHYKWADEYGLLALAIGDKRHTVDTALMPVVIEKSPPSHPDTPPVTSAHKPKYCMFGVNQ